MSEDGAPILPWLEAGAGRPLLAVHGFPLGAGMWHGLLDAARDDRLAARMVAVDLPGFGAAPLPDPAPDVLDVPGLVERLEAVLDAIAPPGSPAVVGVGMAIGGFVLLELAARRPDRFAGLVFTGVRPRPDDPAAGPAREAVARDALDRGSAAVAATLVELPFGPAAPVAAREAFVALASVADPRAIAGLVRGLHRRPDPRPAIDAVRAAGIPVLVVAGADDPFAPLEDGRAFAELAAGELEVLAGIGHIPPLEAPESFARVVARWLARIDPVRPAPIAIPIPARSPA